MPWTSPYSKRFTNRVGVSFSPKPAGFHSERSVSGI